MLGVCARLLRADTRLHKPTVSMRTLDQKRTLLCSLLFSFLLGARGTGAEHSRAGKCYAGVHKRMSIHDVNLPRDTSSAHVRRVPFGPGGYTRKPPYSRLRHRVEKDAPPSTLRLPLFCFSFLLVFLYERVRHTLRCLAVFSKLHRILSLTLCGRT